jgi:hypothetical protein
LFVASLIKNIFTSQGSLKKHVFLFVFVTGGENGKEQAEQRHPGESAVQGSLLRVQQSR